MGFRTTFSQNPIFPVRKQNFLIFVTAHIIMMSQKPNTEDIGTLIGINALRTLYNAKH